jgi:hypothetical protein
MKTLTVISLSAITVLGLALPLSSSVAQQGSLRQQLVGTWTVVSDEIVTPSGTKQGPSGPNPKGILMMDAGGRYATMGGKSDRPKLKSGNRSEVTAQEFGTAAMDFAANYGTWTVNEADKTVTMHREGALNPNNEGTDVKVSVSLAGDELKSVGPGGRTFVYRRAK